MSKLLKPLTHRRYITVYCIADLEVGTVPIKDTFGNVLAYLTEKSKKNLELQGTGRLPSGDLINVAVRMDGEMRFNTVPANIKYGYGIRGKPLEPWSSTALNLPDIKDFDLFKRKIILKQLDGYKTPDNKVLTGEFSVHDTGGGLRACPYERGLFRSGENEKKHGQVDLFIGDDWIYRKLLGHWIQYQDCIIMPRDTYSSEGIQETLNLLLDAGLIVDGKIGTKTRRAINDLKHFAGFEEDNIWDDKTKDFAKKCLDNWRD